MGLSSAMATSLTGLNAAETTISVVGNNLANANTVGFKSSRVSFATQYLQTLSMGGAPNAYSGGTNPKQVGLGVTVAEISPDHTQGTLEISSRATDLAIQGDGFFIVEGSQGEYLYSRNGEFQFNSANELVSTSGNRVMGYGIDEDFEIQRTTLVPITVPLGSEQVAEATENVYMEGSLSPDGDISTLATGLQSAILGDSEYAQPVGGATTLPAPAPPIGQISSSITTNIDPLLNVVTAGNYLYRFVYVQDGTPANPVYSSITNADEGSYENQLSVQVAADCESIDLDYTMTPTDVAELGLADPPYTQLRIYRALDDGITAPQFFQVGPTADLTGVPPGGGNVLYSDGNSQTLIEDPLFVDYKQMDTAQMAGDYDYYVTFSNNTYESRPSELAAKATPNNVRMLLDGFPLVEAGNPDAWTDVNIYRTASGDTSTYYKVGGIPLSEFDALGDGPTFLDYMADVDLIDPTRIGYKVLDMDGPKIRDATLLADVLTRDGSTYENVFTVGETLVFSPKKGGQTTALREMDVTATTTMAELCTFMTQTMGVQAGNGADPLTDIPPGTYTLPDGTVVPAVQNPDGTYSGGHQPGTWVNSTYGRIMVLGNTGEGNALSIDLADIQTKDANNVVSNLDLPFARTQEAVGESATTDFISYDSLGMPVTVSMTCTLVNRDNSATTYRWYADSPDNDPLTGAQIAVGTGLLTFDGVGSFVSATQETVTIDRRHIASASPLQFDFHFDEVSGLATSRSTINVSRQDGSAPGVLTSFMVGEDGMVQGVFSNGVSRSLGQLQLARFSNPQGLEQIGENLFGESINSGLPVQGDPSANGIGGIVAGALELSNTDVGTDLIELILASTTYKANTRVISTSQDMLNELLSIRTG